MNTGAIIKKRRIELGLTLLDVAEACGVSDATVSRWESGNIGNMKTSRISCLADILKLSPMILLGIEEEKSDLKLKDSIELIKIPLYKRQACIDGRLTDDMLIDYFTLPSSILASNREYFAIYSHADYMEREGIFDTDLLVFEKKHEIDDNNIGCFFEKSEGVVVRKIFSRPGTSEIILQPANTERTPLFLNKKSGGFMVLGLLALAIHNKQEHLTNDQINYLWDRMEY